MSRAFSLGVAYDPEQWDEAEWPVDLDMMQAAGIAQIFPRMLP